LKDAKANNPKTTKKHNKIYKGVCMERVSSMNVEEVYLSWDTPGPGISHVADDPPNSAHRYPNQETRTKREYGRQSGRVITQICCRISMLQYTLASEHHPELQYTVGSEHHPDPQYTVVSEHHPNPQYTVGSEHHPDLHNTVVSEHHPDPQYTVGSEHQPDLQYTVGLEHHPDIQYTVVSEHHPDPQ
jgi:hypothetical protein